MSRSSTSGTAGGGPGTVVRMRIGAALMLPGLLALTACSEVGDAVRDSANDAACSAVDSTTSGVRDTVQRAVDGLTADPSASGRALQAVRDALAAAERGISGDAKQALADARDAVADLADQARRSARGLDVDTSEVEDAQRRLGEAVDEATSVCS
ncbi:hypothetical protein [Nocardioides sp. R-C-SC26]|uniref:hypothetical protein n=1 Tax=Nocardioides sp. R-C-SC26 TaxID=2870414 RepID=UPI001E559774|nr:hypothetical protein [Nocardioides sp. R-C-SC26]